MKKNLTLLSALVLSLVTANAQETTMTTTSMEPSYNKWSIELNGGVNKPARAMTPGYYTDALNFFHADLGVRYMFNPKFGLKLDVGYDKFEDGDQSLQFESQMLRASLQGVVNLGRTLNFETWTNTIGLLAHGGFGVSQLTAEDGFSGEDYMAHAIMGVTGQIRLGNRVALTGDISGIFHGRQHWNFDGQGPANSTSVLEGTILNGSLGLTFYLGGADKHADWYSEVDNDALKSLEERIGAIETGLVDSDKDGVADMFDLEPNSIAGVAVNTKGQTIDRNQNGVPDELESYLNNTYGNGGKTVTNGTIEELINGGYVNVYFDFNQDQPTKESLAGVDFLVKYLKANPTASADVIGYADEIGNTDYNKALSQRRAENVKNIITNAGISASRLTVVGNGEDNSVNKDSKQARSIVRRVTFKIK
ncbi:OmpA family protein [Flavobacterium sp. NST-5]|uniref:OmpA family protein n=1 Tax=Flavobacterium ichthyis TaxID=2698827 RepID=A0ABW9Z8I3_9FLAO|nr:OmpA family protein [Flavobacterium ichthyis]NBL65185.1 OmpA family protein [Flavobacterium ichthyis]